MTQQREIIIVMGRTQRTIAAEAARISTETGWRAGMRCRAVIIAALSVLICLNLADAMPASPSAIAYLQEDPFASGTDQDDPFASGASQEDPFGDNPFADAGGDDPSSIPGTTPDQGSVQGAPDSLLPIDESLGKADQLVMQSLRASNPQTDLELARAVRMMISIQQWNDARFYLGRLAAQCTEDQRLFDLHQQMGADYFLTLHGQPELQPLGREFAKRAMAGAKRIAYGPARIDSLIKQLNNTNRTIRSNAFRALRRLGEPGMAALLNVLADDSREKEYPGVRGAVRNFGFGGIQPLLGAIRAENEVMREEAVRGLAAIDRSLSTDALLWAYRNDSFSQPVRRSALDAVNQRLPGLNITAADQRLYATGYQYLTGQRELGGQLSTDVTIWSWDAGTKKLMPLEVPKETASRMAAADRAKDLYELSPQVPKHRMLYLITHLEAAKRTVGPSRTVDVAVLAKEFSKIAPVTSGELEGVLSEALRLDLMPAAAAACEMLAESNGFELVGGSEGKEKPLIRALLSGDRHVQFAAFQAINKINPSQDYFGSSYMTAFAVYLASSEARPKSVVGHLRLDIAQSFATVLGRSGVPGLASSNSRDLYRLATTDPDIELILITDTLDYPRFAELAQQLRSDWRTKRLPIGLVLNDVNNQRRIQHILDADDRLMALPMTLDPQLVAGQVQRLKSLEDPWSLSVGDRSRHAMAALKWLSRTAGQNEDYPFYNLGDHNRTLTKLLYTPGFAENACQILSKLGTPLAQRELLNYASTGGYPLESRKAAASAFAQSINVAGPMLTRAEILLQYERYNASRTQPKESQEILGSILDAIESRAKSQAGSN